MKFKNNVTFCIGTGRMGLALQKAYHEQLALVQDEINFSYIRGHGLFHEDMSIYHTFTKDGKTESEYNFTYLDMVFDDYQSMGLKPFVELGFMPKKMASGDQTVFYWKGNVTPPADYSRWAELIKSTINHFIERYGIEEVRTWPFEVWNEPNLTSFWKDADMEEYFKLYEVTAKAVKEVDCELRVGGPAICGVDDERWLREFLSCCSKRKLPLDFITRHAYGTEAPRQNGHYVYQELRHPQVVLDELEVSRNIIDSFDEYVGMEMHVTEFNSSYCPNNPLHDTNLNAAYIAALLSKMGDTCASYSYWTFGDIFEEHGVPFTPFHGGFGLVANGIIKKPTFYAFAFFSTLYSTLVERKENYVLTTDDHSNYRAVLWNPVINDEPDQHPQIELSLDLPEGEYAILTRTVDEDTCNPLKTWYNLGAPSNPTKQQIETICETDTPVLNTLRIKHKGGTYMHHLSLTKNSLVKLEILKIVPQVDRGYEFG